MTRALTNRLRWIIAAGALALLLVAVGPGPARAAVYPPGGGSFSGGAEGWVTVQQECKLVTLIELGLLCESEGGYEGSVGNPPGSLDARTKVVLDLLSLFNSNVAFRSPEFTVAAAGPATLHLDRQFAIKNLLSVGPTGGYKVVLIDRTTGTQSIVLEEALSAVGETFVGKDAAVSVASGHTYALEIQTSVSSTAKLGLTASGNLRFDNVALTVTPPGGNPPGGNPPGGNPPGSGNGGNGGAGSGGKGGGGGQGGSGAPGTSLSASRLATLLRSSMAASATAKGNRLFIKAKCPAKVGVACRVTVQGLLKRGKPATAPRTAKIAKGKSKQLVLKVKPKFRKAVAKRQKLLFKQTVKAAQTKATVYKRIKLIRR